MSDHNRRQFLQRSALATAGMALSSSALSYSRIVGANDRLNVGVVGVRSRGKALTGSVMGFDDLEVAALCDVDANVLSSMKAAVSGAQKRQPQTFKDFRKMAEDKDLDAVVIASADHTHTPFAIYAMQNDKHVYVEKPLSHNPQEGEWLVAAQQQYGKVVQVGNQQRSAPTSIQAVADIKGGLIGDTFAAKCWYANNRKSIGKGKTVIAPEWLDWDLWQGPAPRTDYRDNIVHYNWHWFWHWGTGEVNNNGLHELDICRWALGVDHPKKVISTGGRYFFNDDWEFYDTQQVTYEYEGDKTITWDGHSCNKLLQYDRGRGTIVYGTKGTAMLDRNGAFFWDSDGNELKSLKEAGESGTTDIVGAGPLVQYHMDNFVKAIKDGATLHSPVAEIDKSNLMCHLGNIAQQSGGILEIDSKSGKIKGDAGQELWGREYEEGWKPV